MSWLRNAEDVAAVVPLHVLLEVEFELTVGVGRAGDSCEGVFSTARTELLVHFFGDGEACMTALDECSEVTNSLQCGR